MYKGKASKKIPALLLAAVMVFGFFPAGVFADDSVTVAATPEKVLGEVFEVNGNSVTTDYFPLLKMGYMGSGGYISIPYRANGDGSYTFTVPENVGYVKLVINGDTNLDGKLSNADATKMKAFLQETADLSLLQVFAGDADMNGKISNADSTKLKAVLKETASFDSEVSKKLFVFSALRHMKNYTAEYSVGAGEDAVYETSLTIPAHYRDGDVVTLQNYGFAGLEGLASVTIPETVFAIGDYAFYGCTSLTELSISANVEYIGGGAFEDCENLTDVYFDGTEEEWETLVGDNDSIGLEPGSVVHCRESQRPDHYERMDDQEIYDSVLPEYEELMDLASSAASDDERYVILAKAEAALLDSAVILPTTASGGGYVLSRVAYRTSPYVNWGSDDSKLKSIVLSSDIISIEEREDLKALWESAVRGQGTYDPDLYLMERGHGILRDYKSTANSHLTTLDPMATERASDADIHANLFDGLLEYDNMGNLCPALAESWSKSEDGLTYTFNLREGVYWYDSEGQPYAELTADDFVAGMQHILDMQTGMSFLLHGLVDNASDYMYGEAPFSEVGCEAVDRYTLRITLETPASYFPTMLSYACFLPMCRSFYESMGGAFGEEYQDAVDSGDYRYGEWSDPSTMVYNGAYVLVRSDDAEIYMEKNAGYYALDSVNIDTVTLDLNAAMDPVALYDRVVRGDYAGVGLSPANGTLDSAMAEGKFETHAYISDATATTYLGGFNLNRGTFALEDGGCASGKDEDAKIDYQLAILNKNFRKALLHSFCKGDYNAASKGELLRYSALRNTLTPPEFVRLSGDVAMDGALFPAGTSYGELVGHYLREREEYIDVRDGVDGWYDPDAARYYLELAMEELGGDVNFPVVIDIVVYERSSSMVAQSEAVKASIEGALGSDAVTVNLVMTQDANEYYQCGAMVNSGSQVNQDFFYGSGWGPDYGDPSTYLNIFLGHGMGYLAKILGLF